MTDTLTDPNPGGPGAQPGTIPGSPANPAVTPAPVPAAPAVPGAPVAVAPPPSDFDQMREGLPPDLRDHMGLKPFTSLEGIARSYLHMQGLMSKKVEDLTPDQLATISSAHGRPDTPEAYTLNRPEVKPGLAYSEELEAEFRGWAHGAGLSQSQAEGLYTRWNDYQGTIFNQVEAEMAAALQTAQTKLRGELGAAYPRKEKAAMAAMEKFGGPDYAKALEISGDGNDPATIRTWMKVADAIGEDQLIGEGRPGGLSVTPEEAKARIPQLMAEKAYGDPNDPAHEIKIKEVHALFQIAYPEDGGAPPRA